LGGDPDKVKMAQNEYVRKLNGFASTVATCREAQAALVNFPKESGLFELFRRREDELCGSLQ
jgi:hypothetical protein